MKRAIVYGYGVSGKGAEKLLRKNGYEVVIVDDKLAMKKEEIIEKLDGFELMVKSPGISPENELIKRSLEKGIEIIDEIELASRYYSGKIIAITGTNGKTTTTAKTKELLEFAGFNVISCGNIGNSFAEVVCEEKEYDYVVLEVSSYQLECIKTFKPYIAMSINHTPDHMTRYKSLEDYYDAKFNIFMNQDEDDYSILNLDDEYTVEVYDKKGIKSKMLFVSQLNSNQFIYKDNEYYKRVNKKSGEEQLLKLDSFYKNGKIYFGKDEILESDKMLLKGIHNIENAFFIISIAKIVGVSNEQIREFLYTTKGLEHRVEEFFKKDNLLFVNDSKGTNIDATIKALDGYKDKVLLICGGKDKNLDLNSLCQKICEKTKGLYLMGETADKLEEICIGMGFDKNRIQNLKTIENVVKKIRETIDTKEENIVLFSPAASSFDQFTCFEERGTIFKNLVISNFGG